MPAEVLKPLPVPQMFVFKFIASFQMSICGAVERPPVKSWVVVYLFSNLGLVSWRWFRGHLGDKG